MAKKTYNMSEEDLNRISETYAKVSGTPKEQWAKYIRELEKDGKFTPENFETLEKLSGGKGQTFASGLSTAITNAQRTAKEAYYANGGEESKTDSAEESKPEPMSVTHSVFPDSDNELIKAKMYDDGLLSWIIDEEDN